MIQLMRVSFDLSCYKSVSSGLSTSGKADKATIFEPPEIETAVTSARGSPPTSVILQQATASPARGRGGEPGSAGATEQRDACSRAAVLF